jgi:hypothetical protein
MGNDFVGIVHPCKIYNILSIGSAFLYIGPEPSHVTELAAQLTKGSQFYGARHGEVDRVVGHLMGALETVCARSAGSNSALAGKFAKRIVLPRMIELLEALNDKEETREPKTVGRGLTTAS